MSVSRDSPTIYMESDVKSLGVGPCGGAASWGLLEDSRVSCDFLSSCMENDVKLRLAGSSLDSLVPQ